MRFSALRLLVSFAVMTVTFPAAAEAAYDMAGKWLLVPSGLRLDLEQSAGTLHQDLGSGIHWSGSINEATGEFHLTVVFPSPEYPQCPDAITLDGFVAADGKTFSATFVDQQRDYHPDLSFDCETVTTTETGSRCGNNELDAGEECDFGDAADGDCCSSACIIADVSTSCTSDGSECTNDICNAVGACEHLAVPGSCVEPHGCGTGECSAGACVVTAPVPTGTPCDRDLSVCTIDACDGAGSCARVECGSDSQSCDGSGETLPCGPCAGCDAAEGCIRDGGYHDWGDEPPVCDEDAAHSLRLVMKTGDNERRHKIRLQFGHGEDSFESLGDPLDDTSYTVCVYADDGPLQRPVFAAAIPAGGTCNDRDCWQGDGNTYVYRDRSLSNHGINLFKVKASGGFELAGKKENLLMPSSLPITATLTPVITAIESDNYYGRRCWSHSVTSLRPGSATKFLGTYAAVP